MLYRLAMSLSWPIRKIYALTNSKFAEREAQSKKHLTELENEDIRYDVWFHAASMGEFFQAKPIVKELKKKYTDIKILVSLFSPSGFKNIKKSSDIDKIIYMPFDTAGNAKRFIETVRPKLTVFVRYEIWQNHISELKKQGSNVWLLAATPPNSKASKNVLASNFIKGLKLFDKIFPVNKTGKQYFEKLGIQTEDPIPDPRYDGILDKLKSKKLDTRLHQAVTQMSSDRRIFIIGSSWPEDDQIISPIINKKTRSLFIILAPHEPTSDYIQKLKSEYNNSITLSELENSSFEHNSDVDVLIIDRVGILLSLYSIGDLAYIGGGFGKGVHSVGEPFGAGLITSAGSDKIHTSPESEFLINNEILTPISNSEQFEKWLKSYLTNNQKLEQDKTKALSLIDKLNGSASTYADFIINELDTSR